MSEPKLENKEEKHVLDISETHDLPRKEASQRIKGLLETIRKKYGDRVADIKESWNDGNLVFSFAVVKKIMLVPTKHKISGTVAVEEGNIRVRCKYPPYLEGYKEEADKIIRESLREVLSNGNAGGRSVAGNRIGWTWEQTGNNQENTGKTPEEEAKLDGFTPEEVYLARNLVLSLEEYSEKGDKSDLAIARKQINGNILFDITYHPKNNQLEAIPVYSYHEALLMLGNDRLSNPELFLQSQSDAQTDNAITVRDSAELLDYFGYNASDPEARGLKKRLTEKRKRMENAEEPDYFARYMRKARAQEKKTLELVRSLPSKYYGQEAEANEDVKADKKRFDPIQIWAKNNGIRIPDGSDYVVEDPADASGLIYFSFYTDLCRFWSEMDPESYQNSLRMRVSSYDVPGGVDPIGGGFRFLFGISRDFRSTLSPGQIDSLDRLLQEMRAGAVPDLFAENVMRGNKSEAGNPDPSEPDAGHSGSENNDVIEDRSWPGRALSTGIAGAANAARAGSAAVRSFAGAEGKRPDGRDIEDIRSEYDYINVRISELRRSLDLEVDVKDEMNRIKRNLETLASRVLACRNELDRAEKSTLSGSEKLTQDLKTTEVEIKDIEKQLSVARNKLENISDELAELNRNLDSATKKKEEFERSLSDILRKKEESDIWIETDNGTETKWKKEEREIQLLTDKEIKLAATGPDGVAKLLDKLKKEAQEIIPDSGEGGSLAKARAIKAMLENRVGFSDKSPGNTAEKNRQITELEKDIYVILNRHAALLTKIEFLEREVIPGLNNIKDAQAEVEKLAVKVKGCENKNSSARTEVDNLQSNLSESRAKYERDNERLKKLISDKMKKFEENLKTAEDSLNEYKAGLDRLQGLRKRRSELRREFEQMRGKTKDWNETKTNRRRALGIMAGGLAATGAGGAFMGARRTLRAVDEMRADSGKKEASRTEGLNLGDRRSRHEYLEDELRNKFGSGNAELDNKAREEQRRTITNLLIKYAPDVRLDNFAEFKRENAAMAEAMELAAKSAGSARRLDLVLSGIDRFLDETRNKLNERLRVLNPKTEAYKNYRETLKYMDDAWIADVKKRTIVARDILANDALESEKKLEQMARDRTGRRIKSKRKYGFGGEDQ